MRSSLELTIKDAVLQENSLKVELSDGRVIIYPLDGMTWITDTSLDVQQDFTVSDWEIYWNQIDDGLTLEHLLLPYPRVDFLQEPAPNWERLESVIRKREAENAVVA